jgi:REP element-mobilizing transposase RayT
MARKPRIEFVGGFYHVITRGNQRQKVFIDEKDFLKYLEFLSDYKDRYGFSIYAYVLMSTHIHLLIETGKVGLSKILQGINQRFTMYFNRRYSTVGHLFQGRYKAILCDRDVYLFSLVKYLHHNPVRAGVVSQPEEYRWSSHREYLGMKKNGLVDTGLLLRMFSEDLKRGRRLYREYMRKEERISKEDFYRTVDQRVLGDEAFVERVRERIENRPLAGRRRHGVSLGEIARGIEENTGICFRELRGKGKDSGVMEGRRLFSLMGREYGYKGKEIAEFLGKDPAAVTGYLRRGQDLQAKLESLLLRLEASVQNLNN